MNDQEPTKVLYYLCKTMDACAYMRCISPGKYLERNHGWKCYYDRIDDIFEMNEDGSYNFSLIKDNRLEILKSCDLVIIQRGTDKGHVDLLRFIQGNLKKPVGYDGDDDYFNVDPSNTGYRYFMPRRAEIQQMISEADFMVVTVPHLAEVYKPYNSNVHVINNYLDFEKIDKSPALANDSKMLGCSVYRCPSVFIEDSLRGAVQRIAHDLLKRDNVPITQENIDKLINGPVQYNIPVNFDAYRQMRLKNDSLVIGWGGSPTHVLDIEITRKPLMEVMKRYRRVNLCFVGYLHMMSLLKSSPYGVNVRKWLVDMDFQRFWLFNYVGVRYYYSMYKTLSWDINIAPVAMNVFNKSKSCLKAIEAMALGQYPIVTDYDTYHGLMSKEGSSDDLGRGRLCKTEEDWENDLYEVLNDHDMRADTIYHNEQWVREKFDIDLESYRWNDVYRKYS